MRPPGRRSVMTHRTLWWGIATLMVSGVLAVTGAWGRDSGRPLARDPELEALEQAVRWPEPDTQTIVTLAGRFVAGRRDREAYAYFEERTKAAPERPLFLALEGFFQARVAGDVFLLRRVAWVNDAVAKLDQAVQREPGITRYFRGLVLAELPARFGKAEAALADLGWVLEHKDRFPVGLRRSVYRAQAR